MKKKRSDFSELPAIAVDKLVDTWREKWRHSGAKSDGGVIIELRKGVSQLAEAAAESSEAVGATEVAELVME